MTPLGKGVKYYSLYGKFYSRTRLFTLYVHVQILIELFCVSIIIQQNFDEAIEMLLFHFTTKYSN